MCIANDMARSLDEPDLVFIFMTLSPVKQTLVNLGNKN